MNRIRTLIAAAGTAAVLVAFTNQTGAQVINWATAVNGSWTVAGNWNPANVPDSTGEFAEFGFAVPYTVTLTGTASPSGINVTNPLAAINIMRDSSLLVGNTNANNNSGTISVFGQSGWGAGSLIWASNAVLNGTGFVTLVNNGGSARIWTTSNGSDTGTIGPGITINGAGYIDGMFINTGTIAGGDSLASSGPVVRGTVTQQGNGLFNIVGPNRRASIGDGTVIGGTIQTSNGGYMATTGNGAMQEVTLSTGSRFEIYRDQSITVRSPGMTNDGTIAVAGQSGWGAGSLIWSADATMNGTGVVALNNNGGSARIWTTSNGSDTGTIGSGVTINGAGFIDGTFINKGTIGGGDSLVSSGPVLRGTMTQQDAGKFNVVGPNRRASIGDGSLIGGSIQTSNGGFVGSAGDGAMQAVTLAAGSRFEIYRDQSITVRSPGMTNDGTIAVFGQSGWGAGSLIWSADAVMNGGGFVTLNNNGGSARIWTTSNGSDTGTIGPGVTINGAGYIDGTFINKGTIGGGDSLVSSGPVLRGTMSQQDAGTFNVVGPNRRASIGEGSLV